MDPNDIARDELVTGIPSKSHPPCLWHGPFDSPVGRLTIVASSLGVPAISWKTSPISRRARAAHPMIDRAKRQLEEYFGGVRRTFDLPLVLDGTPFQMRAWKELSRIPYGETISYEEQARRAGAVRATRAVGSANGKNPIAIVIPCHRVIAKSGGLGGFGGGLPNKRWLLDFESRFSQELQLGIEPAHVDRERALDDELRARSLERRGQNLVTRAADEAEMPIFTARQGRQPDEAPAAHEALVRARERCIV